MIRKTKVKILLAIITIFILIASASNIYTTKADDAGTKDYRWRRIDSLDELDGKSYIIAGVNSPTWNEKMATMTSTSVTDTGQWRVMAWQAYLEIEM